MQRYFNELNFQKGQTFPKREEANGTFILQEAVRKKRNATDEAKETPSWTLTNFKWAHMG